MERSERQNWPWGRKFQWWSWIFAFLIFINNNKIDNFPPASFLWQKPTLDNSSFVSCFSTCKSNDLGLGFKEGNVGFNWNNEQMSFLLTRTSFPRKWVLGVDPQQGLFWGKWEEKVLSPAEASYCRQYWSSYLRANKSCHHWLLHSVNKGESIWCLRQFPPDLFQNGQEKEDSRNVQCLYCFSLSSDCQSCYPVGVSGSNFLTVSPQFNSFEEEERFINNWNKGMYGSGIIFQSLP